MGNEIVITYGDTVRTGCTIAILVPSKAIEEPGYIKTFTVSQDAGSKHEFHAMAQMVYYQYEDGELDPEVSDDPLVIEFRGVVEQVEEGLLILRDGDGVFHAVIHSGLNKRKMLETANRYCTRWVRLDI